MTNAQIEAWVLRVVERTVAGLPNEDSRVELKSGWPGADKAGRRIAGHANASRGDDVLWVIGVDERKRRVVGAEEVEMASWWPQVKAQFDGIPPDLVHLVVPTPHGTVVGLLFDTSRAPYVVVNPASEKGGIQREVPWREGTGVRSAYRHELLTLLVPQLAVPEIELQNARVSFQLGRSVPGDPPGTLVDWFVEAWLYVLPKTSEAVVIPFHRSEISVEVVGYTQRLTAPEAIFGPGHTAGGPRGSITVTGSSTEAIITGPGTLKALARFSTHFPPIPGTSSLVLRISIHPAGASQPASLEASLASQSDHSWVFKDSLRDRRAEGGQYLPPLIE